MVNDLDAHGSADILHQFGGDIVGRLVQSVENLPLDAQRQLAMRMLERQLLVASVTVDSLRRRIAELKGRGTPISIH